MDESTKPIKILFAGNGGGGKTSIISRFGDTYYSYNEISMTPGINIEVVKDPKTDLAAVFWDLGGQPQFRFIQKEFIRGAEIAILVFAVNNYISFRDIATWQAFLSKAPNIKRMILVANKIDTGVWAMSQKDVKQYAKNNNLDYFEISAKEQKGIKELLERIFEIMAELRNTDPENNSDLANKTKSSANNSEWSHSS